MRPFTYVLLMVCIAIAGYWTGNTNMLITLYGQQGNTTLSAVNTTATLDTTTVLNQGYWASDKTSVFSQAWSYVLILILISAAGAIGTVIVGGILQNSGFGQNLGFAAFYIIPMFLLFAVFNFVLMPNSFILDNTMPIEIKIPLVAIMNILLVMALYTAFRGSS